MSVIRVLDFESTDDPGPEAGLCELAYTDVVSKSQDLAGEPCNWEVREGKARLCSPGFPIPPNTAAVHHILDEDVVGLPNWQPLLRSLVQSSVAQKGDEKVIAFGAHGAKMESAWISSDWYAAGVTPIPFICTYKTALRVWKDAPLHSNMGLRYWRRPAGLERAKGLPAHRAGPDSYVTAHHVRDLLNDGCPLQQMIEWTKLPALTVRCRLGSARNGGKGTLWEDVDDGLLQWIVSKRDFDDEDVLYTARHHIAIREEAYRREREEAELNRQLIANGMAPVGVTAAGEAIDRVVVDPNQGLLL